MKHLRPRWAAIPLALTVVLPVLATVSPAAAADTAPEYRGQLVDGPTDTRYVVTDGSGAAVFTSPAGAVDGTVGAVTTAGPTVAYVTETDTDTSYVDQLHLFRAGRGDVVVYTAPAGADVSEPALSPDGSRVLFALDDDTSSALMDVDEWSRTRTIRRSTTTSYAGPSYSPDGSWISWAQETSTGSALVLSKPVGGTPLIVAQASAPYHFIDTAWSPDGSKLVDSLVMPAYGSQRPVASLELRDLRSGSVRRVLTGGTSNGADTSYLEPAWSTDATSVYATKVVDTVTDEQVGLVRLPLTEGAFADPVTVAGYAGSVSAGRAAFASDAVAPAPVTALAASVRELSAHLTFTLPADTDVADLIVTRQPGQPADTPTADIEVARVRTGSVDVALPGNDAAFGISVFTRDWSGNVSPAASLVVRSPSYSFASLNEPPARVVYRKPLALTGRITSSGNPVTGRATLYVRRAGTRTPVAVATAPIGDAGDYVFTYTPAWTAEYQVRYPGSPTVTASASPKRVVSVVPLVSLGLSASRTVRGRTVYVAGGVAPSHAGQLVSIQRYLSGAWRTIATTRLSATSQYRYALKPGTRGSWPLRVAKSADGDHLLAVSPSRTLYVG